VNRKEPAGAWSAGFFMTSPCRGEWRKEATGFLLSVFRLEMVADTLFLTGPSAIIRGADAALRLTSHGAKP